MISFQRPPRILISRLSAIGDCIHCVPLVAAIRAQFPEAFIAWATQAGTSELFRGMHGLDEIITVKRDWLKRFHEYPKLRKQLRAHDFDVTIDPQSLLKSSFLGWLSGARARIGFAGQLGREGSRVLNNRLVTPTSTHVVDRYLELLKPLGIESPQPEFPIPFCAASARKMDTFLQRKQLDRFAILNPGAGWKSKLWPRERYAEVARRLEAQGIDSVVVWAGNQEHAWAREIASNSSAIPAPPTSLRELAALSRRAKFFIGADTGPTHLAAAVGTPCIALYGPTSAQTCGPYGAKHVRLQAHFPNATSRSYRKCDNLAMQAITVDDLMTAIEQYAPGVTRDEMQERSLTATG